MSGSKIALDTNQVIAILNGQTQAVDILKRFSEIYLPVPVIGELRFGSLNSSKAEENLKTVETFVSRCAVLDATGSTAIIYAELRIDLKKRGKPIPENDLWIAAICVDHGISLATNDQHLSYIKRLELVGIH